MIKELTNDLGIDYVVASAKQETNVKNSFLNLITSIYDTMFADEEAPNKTEYKDVAQYHGLSNPYGSTMMRRGSGMYCSYTLTDQCDYKSAPLTLSSRNVYMSAKKSKG